MRNLLSAAVIGPVLLISTALSQTTTPASHEILSNGSLLHSLLAAPVIGQPYSAIQVHRDQQQLADGTHITHNGHHFVARDPAGRVRIEMRVAQSDKGETVLVFVTDPEAHAITTWATGPNVRKLASVIKIPAEKSGNANPASARTTHDNRPQPVITTEDLGNDTLQGIPVAVVKTTTIVPIGRSGNDAPITKTHEVWTSPDLKLIMKEQWEDPRTGERTLSLEKFSRADPDPALFHPPAGYSVKDFKQSLQQLEEQLNATQN
jgi:hypothetical protein